MDWLSIFGIVIVVILMIPNIIYAVVCKDSFHSHRESKVVGVLEQIGRYSCIAFMIVRIPGTYFGFAGDNAFALYLMLNCALLLCYCIAWIVKAKIGGGVATAAVLSAVPSAVFLLSGILSRSFLLIGASLIFAPCHILISCKNAAAEKRESHR